MSVNVHEFVQLNRVIHAVNKNHILDIEELADPMDVRNGIVPYKEILCIEISQYGAVFVELSDRTNVAAAYEDTILVGEQFTLFSVYQRLAIILHEVGHCLLHMNIDTPQERLYTKEVEADSYAAFALGKLLGDNLQGFRLMIETLEMLIQVFGFQTELQERIHALRNIILRNFQQYIH